MKYEWWIGKPEHQIVSTVGRPRWSSKTCSVWRSSSVLFHLAWWFSFFCLNSSSWIVFCQDFVHSTLGTFYLKKDVFLGHPTVPQGFDSSNLTSRNVFHSTHLQANDLETKFSSFYTNFADLILSLLINTSYYNKWILNDCSQNFVTDYSSQCQ